MTPDDLFRLLRQNLPALEIKGPEAVALLDPGVDTCNLNAGVVALPADAVQISELLRFCNARRIAVVPHGGRTGLAGGAVTEAGQLILSLARLTRIQSVDAAGRLAVVEAGVTLAALQLAAAQHGLMPAIDLGARTQATIGGMISTNAGGIEAFRHGVMRARVLGLEAVLPDGTIMSDLAHVTKCNEGTDVKQLFIGTEGTLGVVTRAVVRLEPAPLARATALVFAPGLEDAQRLFQSAGTAGLLAFELMNPRYALLAASNTQFAAYTDEGSWALVVETEGADSAAAAAALQELLESGVAQGWVSNALIAKSEAERRAIWVLREDSWVVDRAFPGGLWYDVTIPQAQLSAYAMRLEAEIPRALPGSWPFIIGHLGDGNLHITLAGPKPLHQFKAEAARIVIHGLKQTGGSFSAEHGIGLEKRENLANLGDAGKLAMMRIIKHALDPHGIMNPGKVLE